MNSIGKPSAVICISPRRDVRSGDARMAGGLPYRFLPASGSIPRPCAEGTATRVSPFRALPVILGRRRGSEPARKVVRERVTVGVLACSYAQDAEAAGRAKVRQASPVTLSCRKRHNGWAATTAEGPQSRGNVRPFPPIIPSQFHPFV